MADEGTNPTPDGVDDFDLPLTGATNDAPSAAGDQTQPPGTAATDPAAASGLPGELWQAMREENLRVVPGESVD